MRKLLSNRLFTWLLCITLLSKVMVPVGFMPDMNALQHGIYKITICSGYGPKEVWVDQSQKQADPKQRNHSDHQTTKHDLCPFAGFHASALPILGIALAMLLLWGQVSYRPKDADFCSVALVSAYPRGPPLTLA